ncbi:FAD-binding oxidoreductase [Thalassobius sp. I31.1]|uniref:NAD(P)/FAD-dependent oxidoreductase n=1 Tax=Thalassobius sp. I31.1 TaxID=2109912 RepID=UPI000D1B2780|nr:FAD-binding oxidoreductase [Thalassobius sp. I31.1]
MAMADVTIYGAGIAGLTLAWCCVQRGAKVQIWDKRAPGVGSSGGLVGALAPHVPENWNPKKAFQFESLMMAEPFWAEIGAAAGMDPGYSRSGRLQPIADGAALLLARSRRENAKVLWEGQARWDVIPADQAGAWAPDAPGGWLIHDTLTARLSPRKACAALTAAIRAEGGVLLSADQEPEPEGKAIYATGYEGLLELSEVFEKPVGNGVKGQGALLKYDAGDAPQLFADGVHIVPHANGTVAIGSTSEREFDSPDSTDEQLDAVIEKALNAVPVLRGAEVVERWAGVRPRAKSRAPMIGAVPGAQDVFVSNGGFKIGFGMAPKIATIMADLVLDGVDNIPDDFRVEANL